MMRIQGKALLSPVAFAVLTSYAAFAENAPIVTGEGNDQLFHYAQPIELSETGKIDILSRFDQRQDYEPPIPRGGRWSPGPSFEPMPDFNPAPENPFEPPAPPRMDAPMMPEAELDPVSTFINIAKAVWPVIQKNQPVANVSTDYVTALPAEISNPYEVENFSDLQVSSYRFYAKNLFGMTVYDVVLSAVHQYGGKFDGKGAYLDTVSIIPSNVDVLWGYTLDMTAAHVRTTNAGTKDEPIARMIVDVDFRVKTIIKSHQTTLAFEFRGDKKQSRKVN